MKIYQATDSDLEKVYHHICTLCGYPALTSDKAKVLTLFLKNQNGESTTDDMLEAYNYLAAGKLDEKMDSFKSLTGLSASRILAAYNRTRTRFQDGKAEQRAFLHEENKQIIQEFSGRMLLYNDEVNDRERSHLMQHWIGVQKDQYYQHQRPEMLTSTSFDFLEKNGTLRVKDGIFQYWNGRTFVDICQWDDVETRSVHLKKREDMMVQEKGNLHRMMSPFAGGSIDDARKRQAMAIYFDTIKP